MRATWRCSSSAPPFLVRTDQTGPRKREAHHLNATASPGREEGHRSLSLSLYVLSVSRCLSLSLYGSLCLSLALSYQKGRRREEGGALSGLVRCATRRITSSAPPFLVQGYLVHTKLPPPPLAPP